MTTPQWTVDEDGVIVWRQDGGKCDLTVHAVEGWPSESTAYAALVADVAAARLVDDMKAKLANSVEVTVGGMGTVHALGPPECVEAVRQAIAKARLVDDMAAVVRRLVRADDDFGAHTKQCDRSPCQLCLMHAEEQSEAIEAAREAAALHHARPQEQT